MVFAVKQPALMLFVYMPDTQKKQKSPF